MVPRVGQKIGPYEILGRLGSGGMGLVFSAWDARLQRDVAIKLLRDEYSSLDMRQRFLQEARAASGLNHPNICTIFDIGEQGGDPYLVMELLKGETLRARILSGALSADDITRVATEVADALSVAHSRGIIHRDIKPANIILVDKPGGRFGTKVLDFGLAKVDLGDGFDPRYDLTNAGSTVGTASYMSPEQARGEPLDARSDLFSLGVVLYEMATGQLPFQGATSALVFVQLLSRPPDPPREINAAIPKELERIILRLLEKDRNSRFQTASELVEALHKIPIRGSSTGKSIWGAIPSLIRSHTDIPAARPPAEEPRPPAHLESERPKTVPPHGGESVLRPVKRIVTSDLPLTSGSSATARPQAEPHNPAPVSAVPVPEPAGQASRSSVSEPVAPPETIPSATTREIATHISGTFPVLSRSSQKIAPATRFHRRDDEFDEPPSPTKPFKPHDSTYSRTTYLVVLVLIVTLAAGAAVWLFWPKHNTAIVNEAPAIVMTALTNRSGDDILSGVVACGLQFDLEQSPRFSVQNHSMLVSGLKVIGLGSGAGPSLADARQAAQAIGASHVLFGDIRNDGASSYIVSIHVYDVSTGTKTVDASETAVTREQMPDTIDRLASTIRLSMGESGDTLAKAVPLSKEATSNLDALQDYVNGADLLDSGQLVESMHAFQRATVADPHFPQAWFSLAEIYRRQHAGVAAAQAAQKARETADSSSQRTQLLGQASDAINNSGDYPQAVVILQKILDAYPADSLASVQMANALRVEGKFTESLEVAKRLLEQSPYDADASGAAESSMLAQNNFGGALQLETQIQRSGHSHPGIQVLISYLDAGDTGQVGVDLSASNDRVAPLQYHAGVLDAGGLFEGGLREWRGLAAQASANPELASAAGEELSNAAMNRAFVGDCSTALTLVHDASSYPQTVNALFFSGMSSVLCGQMAAANAALDSIQKNFPRSYPARSYLYPDLKAAIQWKSNDPDGALKTLQAANSYDLISVTSYLRGLIHLNANQPHPAVGDFQSVLEHRGAMVLTNPLLYPLAQIGVARAWFDGGDKANSSAAYRKFAVLWSAAGSGQDLVREARQNSK